MNTRPVSGSTSPAAIFNRVDFPEPLRPDKADALARAKLQLRPLEQGAAAGRSGGYPAGGQAAARPWKKLPRKTQRRLALVAGCLEFVEGKRVVQFTRAPTGGTRAISAIVAPITPGHDPANNEHPMILSRAASIDDLRGRRQKAAAAFCLSISSMAGRRDEINLKRNRQAFEAIELTPRSLVDISPIDTETTLFGRTWAVPFGMAPRGLSQHGLARHRPGGGAACSGKGHAARHQHRLVDGA